MPWVCVEFGCAGLLGRVQCHGQQGSAGTGSAGSCRDVLPAGKAAPALRLTRLPGRPGKSSADFRSSHRGKIQLSRRRRRGDSTGTDMATGSPCGLQSEGEARGGLRSADLFPGKISHDFTASSANMKKRSGPM